MLHGLNEKRQMYISRGVSGANFSFIASSSTEFYFYSRHTQYLYALLWGVSNITNRQHFRAQVIVAVGL